MDLLGCLSLADALAPQWYVGKYAPPGKRLRSAIARARSSPSNGSIDKDDVYIQATKFLNDQTSDVLFSRETVWRKYVYARRKPPAGIIAQSIQGRPIEKFSTKSVVDILRYECIAILCGGRFKRCDLTVDHLMFLLNFCGRPRIERCGGRKWVLRHRGLLWPGSALGALLMKRTDRESDHSGRPVL